MDIDPRSLNIHQPALFDFRGASTGAVELFPAVWSALEDLVSSEIASRRDGLQRLEDLSAPRLSPLVAYMLATRLSEPDLQLRGQILSVLADVLAPDPHGFSAPEPVLRYLHSVLSKIRLQDVIDLLEAAEYKPAHVPQIARLLNACPYAGGYLAEIVGDRKRPLPLRSQAASMIGLVGYLDTIPALERLALRLESRLEGQQSMPFAPPVAQDEAQLLPAVRSALDHLKAV